MKPEKQTSRDFYKHSETGEIFCIEHRWDGTLLASCGPLSEPLKDKDDYEITNCIYRMPTNSQELNSFR